MQFLKTLFLLITTTLLFQSTGLCQTQPDTLRTVKMTAVTDEQAVSLTIQWQDDPSTNSYDLYKKLRQDTTWGAPIYSTIDQNTSYLDTDIEEGMLYEYQIIKTTGDSLGYAYLFSGINYMPSQKRGDILLLVESVAADFVEDNLNTYSDILISEGWNPLVIPIPVDASVPEVKSIILQNYADLDSLTSVVLMGNIAVPHSGNINPDGHINHRGAWPADVYYGDMDGVWTDETVNNNNTSFPGVANIPGDGRFDQDSILGELELAIGRLDFSELPVFDLNEYELLDRYLEKNIAFRTGVYQTRRRAIFRNINPWGEGLGQNAIRNFVPLFSNDSIAYNEIHDAFDEPYLWSYFGSAGFMTGAFGLGDINTFNDDDFQVPFTAFFGSTYGDYDFENNFLRVVLASGDVLSTAWVGAPSWHFHPMAMGMDLGFCAKITQNNPELYYPGVQEKYVTINLLGDPTLKTFIVKPPTNLTVIQNGNHNELSWTASQDDILGYQVFKKTEGMDYYEILNETPITATTFTDLCIDGETFIQYMVKAVKQELTPSGSYLNHSTSPIASIQTTANIFPEANFDLVYGTGGLSGMNSSTNANQYLWIFPDGSTQSTENFEIDINIGGLADITLIASNDCYSDTLQQSILITDIANLIDNEPLDIFPNPTKDIVSIDTNQDIDELQIYDVLGRNIFTQTNLTAGSHDVSLKEFEPGVYLFKVRSGNKISAKKILLID